MKTSEQVDKISEALAKAQGQMRNPEKNKTATIPMKAGGSYSYDYADLPSTFDCVRKQLSEAGIGHSFGTVVTGEYTLCSCRISHSSGQWFESEMVLPSSADIKSMAGNLTYLKRYLFCGLVGITGDDDLDSEPDTVDSKYEDRQRPAPSKTPNPVAPKAQVKSNTDEPRASGAVSGAVGDAERNHVMELVQKNGWTGIEATTFIHDRFGKTKVVDLTRQEYNEVVAVISTKSFTAWQQINNLTKGTQKDVSH